MNIQFVLLVLGVNLQAVTAYRNGLVSGACSSMIPGHNGTNVSPLDPPYTVTSDVLNYTDGQVITVTLQGNDTGFKGFLLQARNGMGPVGTFTILGDNSQLLNCGTEGSAVSHNSSILKSTVVAQWNAPNSNNTDIRFRATFVQNFSVYWVGVESRLITYLASDSPNATVLPPNSTVLPPNSTVLPPNSTVLPPNSTVLPPNSTVLPPNSTVLPPNSTVLPPNSTILPPNSTVLPPNSTVLPPSSTVLPPNSTVLPPNSTVLPPNSTVLPPNSTVLPPSSTVSTTQTTVLSPATTKPNSSSSVSVAVCLLLLPLLTII
ncbi:putative ferric-chelate reductase 1 [Danio aesculapii]|uniref:putative ferric-chelate reductase 1 n=1 Tax=Danio aesculapii TaxID=1142201 RepID=UPI0024BF552C|nr:putative ferric-chelate reductase 1 [Danio aesculapii]